jgi:CRP-like cAMP-binding protein
MRVAPVSQDVQAQLSARASRRNEPAGAILFRRDEPAFGVFLLLKGSVSLRLEGASGKVILNRIATSESILGLPASLAGGRYSLTAVTLEESEIAFLGLKDLQELVREDANIGLELMQAIADEVLQMREILVAGDAVSKRVVPA